jgi:very-short-patch-repair endonuclease
MKLSNIDIQKRLDNKKIPFEIVSYTKYTKPSLFRHKICEKEFSIRLDHLLERNTCPHCDGRKRDLNRFQIESDIKHNSEYLILEFENGNKPVKIKHKICEYEFYQVGCRHLRGDRCPKCYGNVKYTKKELIDISEEKWKGDYDILSDSIEYNKKSLIRHKKCGYEYTQLVSSHINGLGCPKCAGNAPHTKESIQEKSDKIHHKEYIILSNPKGKHSKIKILHKNCNQEFTQVVSDHLSGCGCINCNSSKGEKVIERILNKMNLKYHKQMTFNECRYKNKLKFDFFLPEKNICIEYDGQQHFFPIRYFGGKKSFELQKIKDEIKNQYCYKNNIKLIRIKYDTKMDEINSIIESIN